ncbi:hypothetical protein GQ55_8G076400 [Panicum hallii var. hallii]|uniref:Peptidase A2 domain-containing protein n=1 Tax=Panicum hallii var. hallii TaxID=1504633 RepID=A0A2T7CLR5_9POAL|nr:hypothetical protein GQ55_8G076400 [Panicum hallii var. hallii]
MVEGYDRSARRQLNFALGINMTGLAPRRRTKNEEADPCDWPQKGEKGYITEEQVRHIRNQRPASSDLLKKYECQYSSHCPFFRYCWDSGMSRLPTTKDCLECGSRKRDAERKRRVQRLHSLEEAEARYLETLRKARPDLADKVHYTQKRESRPPKKEWRQRSRRAEAKTSADAHMVFVLPAEFHARGREELSVAQLDLGPRPVIFEKPQAKNYKHLKALYLKGYINGQPVNKMLVDTGAAVNIMPYSVLRHLGRSAGDLIKTNITLSDFNGQTLEAQGVRSVDLTVGNKTVPTSFFIINSKSTYNVLLGRDWIHANCCIPSTMHQCLIQWDGDEVEVVYADDSIEISHAAMSIWDTEDQEPISGISLEGCYRIEATKNGVRLVLSTGLTE